MYLGLFEHEKVDVQIVEQLVKRKTANKLYPILNQDGLIGNKRRISPPVEIPDSKSKRNAEDDSASPDLRKREQKCVDDYQMKMNTLNIKSRVCSVGDDLKIRRKGRKRTNSLTTIDPKQRLIKNVWKDLIYKTRTKLEDKNT